MKTYFTKVDDSRRAEEARADLNRIVDERLAPYADMLRRFWVRQRDRVPVGELRNVIGSTYASKSLKEWIYRDYAAFWNDEVEGIYRTVAEGGERYALEVEGGLFAGGSIVDEYLGEAGEVWIAAMITRQVAAYERIARCIQTAESEGVKFSDRERLGLMIGATGLNEPGALLLFRAQTELAKIDGLRPGVMKRLGELLASGATLTADYELSRAYADAKRLKHAQALRLGLVKRVERTWATQRDDKVCKYCRALNGIRRVAENANGMYAPFNAQVPGVGRISQQNTPRHHRCRCSIVYRVLEYDPVKIAAVTQSEAQLTKVKHVHPESEIAAEIHRIFKHLPGQHDQRRHGRRYRRVSGRITGPRARIDNIGRAKTLFTVKGDNGEDVPVSDKPNFRKKGTIDVAMVQKPGGGWDARYYHGQVDLGGYEDENVDPAVVQTQAFGSPLEDEFGAITGRLSRGTLYLTHADLDEARQASKEPMPNDLIERIKADFPGQISVYYNGVPYELPDDREVAARADAERMFRPGSEPGEEQHDEATRRMLEKHYPKVAKLSRVEVHDPADPKTHEQLRGMDNFEDAFLENAERNGVSLHFGGKTDIPDMDDLKELDRRRTKTGGTYRDNVRGIHWNRLSRNPNYPTVVVTGRHGGASTAAHEFGHNIDELSGVRADPNLRGELKDWHTQLFPQLSDYVKQSGPGDDYGLGELWAYGVGYLKTDPSVGELEFGKPYMRWVKRTLGKLEKKEKKRVADREKARRQREREQREREREVFGGNS